MITDQLEVKCSPIRVGDWLSSAYCYHLSNLWLIWSETKHCNLAEARLQHPSLIISVTAFVFLARMVVVITRRETNRLIISRQLNE